MYNLKITWTKWVSMKIGESKPNEFFSQRIQWKGKITRNQAVQLDFEKKLFENKNKLKIWKIHRVYGM